MTRFRKNRLSKLESLNQPTQRVRRNVVEYCAETGAIIGPVPPKGTKVMMVPHFKDWPAALMAQQERLIAEARNETNERQTT